MGDYEVTTSGVFGEIEYFDSHEELNGYLERIKPYLASIIIEFNCLEDELTNFLCEMYGDENQEKIYVVLSEMMFKKKAVTLFKLYNIENKRLELGFAEEIKQLDKIISECGQNRNEYAHGSWLHASPSKGVSVKVKASNAGIESVYRRFDENLMQEHLNRITSSRAHLKHFHNRFVQKFK